MASDNSDSDDAFYGAMDGFVDSIKHSLSPELRALVGHRLLETESTNSAANALKVLYTFLNLSAKPCSPKVKVCVGNAILDNSDPVELFFGYLPDPQSHEIGYFEDGGRPIVEAYIHAHDVLKYLSLVQGRKMLKTQSRDTLLDKLFEIMDRADGPAGLNYAQWSEDLLRLVWEISRETDIRRTRTERTSSLIEYLCWVIRGRKDAVCTVPKPRATVDLPELRRSAYDDLSRLPHDAPLGNCAKCSAEGANIRCTCCWLGLNGDHGAGAVYCSVKCRKVDSGRHKVSRQEFRELYRLTTLFQIVFVQYLLSINYNGVYTVSADDEMVTVFMDGSAPEDLATEAIYKGFSPDLDLSLPKVEAALHAFGCCAIKDPARALLEYFFRSSSTSIEFIDFVPKNAHIPVLEQFKNGRSRFNMSPRHTVAVLRTNSGLQFILDPTAAQYGWKENIAPREIYTRYRINRELINTVCLAPSSPGPRTEHTLRPKDESELVNWKHKCVAEDTVDLAEDHFSANGGLQGVLQLPQDQFEEQCLALRETLKSGMRIRDEWREFCEKNGAVLRAHS